MFYHFLFISSFFDFFNVFSFSSFIFQKQKFLLFFLLRFLSNILNCWRQYQSLTVSSVVGAPWRCGVLTTWGLGWAACLGESMLQLGVEAPRL